MNVLLTLACVAACECKDIGYAILAGSLERLKFVHFQIEALLQQSVPSSSIVLYVVNNTAMRTAVQQDFGHVQHFYLPESPAHSLLANSDRPAPTSKLVDMNWNYRTMFDDIFWRFPYAVILEDDLLLAPDTNHFFRWGADLLDLDPTVLSVSGHNINANPLMARDSSTILRENTFGGLGWLTSRLRYADTIVSCLEKRTRGILPWDSMIANNIAHFETVFPEVPRTLHVADHSGRHAELFQLAFNFAPKPALPSIYNVLLDVYDEMLRRRLVDACSRAERVLVLPNHTRAAWSHAYTLVYGKDFGSRLHLYAWGIGGKPKVYHSGLVVLRDLDYQQVFLLEKTSAFVAHCEPLPAPISVPGVPAPRRPMNYRAKMLANFKTRKFARQKDKL